MEEGVEGALKLVVGASDLGRGVGAEEYGEGEVGRAAVFASDDGRELEDDRRRFVFEGGGAVVVEGDLGGDDMVEEVVGDEDEELVSERLWVVGGVGDHVGSFLEL
jgi:hypothetical protein